MPPPATADAGFAVPAPAPSIAISGGELEVVGNVQVVYGID